MPGSTYRPIAAAVTIVLCHSFHASAQTTPQANPYVMHGSAVQNTCNCYTLTPQQNFQAGQVWNKNEIDLTQSFDYHFNVFLGCQTGLLGADGIAFVLQPINTSQGSTGDGLGFGGIVPSLGVTIDTYQNTEDDDPAYDHIAFQANGDVNHADANNLAGPVQALANNPNIKDCNWHVLEVKWDAPSTTLTAYMDGVVRLTLTKDLVGSIFSGSPQVFWGFTASTGGSDNLQQFCTSLNAGHSFPSNQTYCEDVPITFRDSSTSFGSIVNWYWDFGDGDTSMRQNPPPHVYPKAGVYTVTQSVLGNNGCLSDPNKTVLTIGTYPVADFIVGNGCTGQQLPLVNSSFDTIGRFATWNWALSTGQTFTDSLPAITLTQPGNYSLSLSTVSVEGCASNTFTLPFTVNATPAVTFDRDSVCAGTPLALSGTATAAVPIRQWYWQLGTDLDSGQTVTRVYPAETTFIASLWAESPQGCYSDTVQQPIAIQASHAYAGRDTAVALGYPIQLQGSGGATYAWSPATGLSDPDIANPVATIGEDTRYTLTAYTTAGCASTATILIKVYKGPAIYVPSAFTPNGDGANDVLRLVAPGIRTLNYFQIFDRWGHEVYHTTDLQATWDGTVSGTPAPDGTYVYTISAIDMTGHTMTQRGTILIIR
ncbi:MAG TPA: PKD domain-containing protein [Dinghuibacter sp.]|uniref:lectin-like domain-containing protein n=1 Tax=Dinghuibacter sp. TaxID=2024697 RepID=UPI002C934FA5|nr:PKD domain-containing protein [Dinghuibacter sp.]HTJ10750.1 PKD domain-containing protein [Dinghuibacter sp.]